MKRSAIPALRAAYDAQQASLVRWLTDVLPDAWDERSVLSEWTVRELAFHTTEVPGALTRALEGGPVRERALTVAEYTAAWRAASADIAARDRKGAEGCTSADVIARHRSEHAVLAAALDELENDPVVRARRGPIRVSDFLATRVNELVVHARDLSASVPSVPAVELNNDALGVSVRMLLDILVERAPGRSVEVRVPPYAAVQCVEGPRHTRGKPPNVVESDPLLWVEIACGRASWTDAAASGRLHVRGERADLSALLPLLS